MNSILLTAALGGLVLGVAVSLMLLLRGRVTGVSGIINGLLVYKNREWGWRGAFVLGLLSGGAIISMVYPEAFGSGTQLSSGRLLLAGLLVGFGTVTGNGCTSGHGICGVARLSKRSILATFCFMLAGMVMVYFLRHVMGE